MKMKNCQVKENIEHCFGSAIAKSTILMTLLCSGFVSVKRFTIPKAGKLKKKQKNMKIVAEVVVLVKHRKRKLKCQNIIRKPRRF